MKISTQTRYAIRFLYELSVNGSGQKRVTAKQAAESQGISEKYLESIAAKLCRNGYVNSIKGVGGGYALARPIEEISVGEIIELMEKQFFEIHCVPNADTDCVNYEGCAVADFWEEVSGVFREKTFGTKLSEVFKD